MIPQYIEALEDAQQQAKRANMPIDDATLVMYVTRVMLSTERNPRQKTCGGTSARSTGRGKIGRPLTPRPNAKPS